jgi:hypothetical protein
METLNPQDLPPAFTCCKAKTVPGFYKAPFETAEAVSIIAIDDRAMPTSNRRLDVTFRCQVCGFSTFTVTTVLSTVVSSVKILLCTDNPKSIAAVHLAVVRERERFSGILGADLRVGPKSWTKVDQEFDHNSLTARCNECFSSPADGRWVESFRTEEVADPYFQVACARCDREIPFGWTDGPRLGRIVLFESSGFDLASMFPEPRFCDQQAGVTGGVL